MTSCDVCNLFYQKGCTKEHIIIDGNVKMVLIGDIEELRLALSSNDELDVKILTIIIRINLMCSRLTRLHNHPILANDRSFSLQMLEKDLHISQCVCCQKNYIVDTIMWNIVEAKRYFLDTLKYYRQLQDDEIFLERF